MYKKLSDKEEKIATKIVDCAFKVHNQLGPGLLEKIYEICFCYELKAVEELIPLFDAQLLSYLKLTQKRLGFLINFNVSLIKEGIKRIII